MITRESVIRWQSRPTWHQVWSGDVLQTSLVLPKRLEFSDDDIEEEKDEVSNELVVTLKQRITALEEQVAEDDFVVLCMATTSKLKRFAKALGDPSLYNVPSP
jgi:hypothetical protein